MGSARWDTPAVPPLYSARQLREGRLLAARGMMIGMTEPEAGYQAIYRRNVKGAADNGVLIEVDPELTRQAGYRWRVWLSQSVVTTLTLGLEGETEGQSLEAQLWDLLNSARVAIDNIEPRETLAPFELVLGKDSVALWARLERARGPAVHIMTPTAQNADARDWPV